MAYSSQLSLPSFTSAPRAGPLNPSRSILPSTLLGRGSFRPVRCQAENDSSEQQQATPVTPPSASAPPPPPPRKAPGVSTKFSDIFAFGGPAPERINGRLAMVGFMSALAVELARGDDLLAQLSSGGSTWFVGTAVLLSVASLVPLVKGVTAQSRSGGLMTADAEMWNGRFAMLGLVALALTEYLKGGPLV